MVQQAKQLLNLPTASDPELALLLHTYRVVFDAPMGLPPERAQNHSIPLLQGSNPVKCRLYHYPYRQKEQIEVIVKDMLKDGIIQLSSSPFSSPIILVKKKKGWHMEVLYGLSGIQCNHHQKQFSHANNK